VEFEVLTAVVMNVGVSEQHITSIFRVENQPSKKSACSRFTYGLHDTVSQIQIKIAFTRIFGAHYVSGIIPAM
jgi:hypothetical protein